MSEKEQIFKNLAQLADMITQMFGDNCEVAVHDLTTTHQGLRMR